jgi:hypothetical protein
MKRFWLCLLVIVLWSIPAFAQVTNVRIADGDDKNAGKTTDAAVTTDTSGTLSGKVRGLIANQTNGTQQANITRALPTSLTTLQNAATANGNGTPMDVSGYSSLSLVITGTFDATVYFEGTIDGANWIKLTSVPWNSGGFWADSWTEAGSFVTSVGSLSQVRARIADYVSGTVTVKAVGSLAFSTIANKGIEIIPTTAFRVVGAAGPSFDSPVGADAAPPNQIVTGGVYNSTKPTLTDGQAVAVQVDTKGNQLGVIRDAAGNDRGANVNASNQLLVDGSSVTQPVSASSLPLPTGAATSTKQSDGSQKAQVVDGSGNVIGSTSNALDVNIKSGNPTTITATQATGTNLHTVVDSGAVNATLQAGSALVGKVGIDQTTPGTTNKVTVGSDVVHTIIDSGTTTVTQATASNLNAQVVGAAASGASKAGNPVQTGSVFNTTQPTVTNGQVVESQATSRGAQIVATGVDTFNTTINTALPAGTNVIGHVINDSGSTTAVTGNVTVVQPTGTNLHAVLDANSGVDIGRLTANQSVNVTQIAGSAVTTGNGTAAGSQRVTIASDSTGSIAATQSGTWTAQPVPGTTNGASTCVAQSAASTNATNCKASAGLLYGVEVINTTSTIYYLRLYNLSSSPTCSSATGFIRTIPIPHGSGAGAGIANFYTVGETYGTGIGFCLTGGGSGTDNTNAAVGVYVSLHFK